MESTTAVATTIRDTARTFDFEGLQIFASNVKDLVVSTVTEISRIVSTVGDIEPSDEIRDPVVKFELEQLRHALKELVTVCKRFVHAAKSLARYAMNEEMLSTIQQELAADPPVIKTLLVLLKGVQDQFKRCIQLADTFVIDYDKIIKNIEKQTTANKIERDEQVKEFEGNQLQAKKAMNEGVGIGVGGTVVAGLAGGIIGVATGGVGIPLALLMLSTAAATAAGATAKVTISANFYAAARFSAEHLQLLESTTDAVTTILRKVNELKVRQNELDGYISDAKAEVEAVESEAADKDPIKLKEQTSSLKVRLGMMKDSMKVIYDCCNSVQWNVQ